MITYINDFNARKYSKRFEEATLALMKAELKQVEDKILDPKDCKFITFTNGQVDMNEQLQMKPKRPIDSIESYFRFLPKLMDIDVEAEKANAEIPGYDLLHSKGRRFTILPVLPSAEYEKQLPEKDERIFDIDANARTITIPRNFAANGVGVQGDQLAETVYFRIDRFFDSTDLDTADIFIQWVDAAGNKGLSIPWVVDIESEPGKIIFGWAISSNVAAQAGNIQFSVRFYQWGNNDKTVLRYSLSTQTASIAVKNSLDFKITDIMEYEALTSVEKGIQRLIRNRIKDSITSETNVGTVKEPVFVVDMEDLDNITSEKIVNNDYCVWYKEPDSNKPGVLYADLIPVTDPSYANQSPNEDPKKRRDCFTIRLQARSQDAGTLEYQWTKQEPGDLSSRNLQGAQIVPIKNENDEVIGAKIEPSEDHVSIEFIPTEDEEVLNKDYYREEDGRWVLVSSEELTGFRVSGDNGLIKKTPKSEGWCEKFSICQADSIGTYRLTVTNTKYPFNSKNADSQLCIIPPPSKPDFEEDLGKNIILEFKEDGGTTKNSLDLTITNIEKNGTHPGKLSVKWYKKIIDSTGATWYNTDAEEAINIPVKLKGTTATPVPYETDENAAPIIDSATRQVYPINSDGDRLTQEEMKEQNIVFEIPVPENGAKISLDLYCKKDDVTALEDRRLDINEGIYFARVFNEKNGEVNSELISKDCRVSYQPEEPILVHSTPEANNNMISARFTLKNLTDSTYINDEMSLSVDKDWLKIFNISDEITYQWYHTSDVTLGNSDDYLIPGETSNYYKPDPNGEHVQFAYCKVTNHKNGHQVSVNSPIYMMIIEDKQ